MAPTWTGTQAGLGAVDPNGNILVVIHSAPGDGAAGTFTLERRTSSQTLDQTWGTQGSVALTGTPLQLAVTPSNTVVVLTSSDNDMIGLTVLDETGAPLAGFDATASVTSAGLGNVGIASGPWELSPYDANFNARVSMMAVQPDGAILLLTGTEDSASLFVTRVAATGSVDTAFGTGGRIPITGATPLDIALLPDGNFVVVTESTTTHDFLPTWYGPTGTVLGTGGTQTSHADLLARSDGSALVGTYSGAGGSTVSFATYTDTGANDPTPDTAVVSSSDHRFIGPGDVLTTLPVTGNAITEGLTLPDGTAEASVTATLPSMGGATATIANAVPGPAGTTLLLGQMCTMSGNTYACATLVTELTPSGALR